MRCDANGGRSKNYEPNSFDGPVETGERYSLGDEVSGAIGPTAQPRHPEDDDFVQAGALYPVMKEDGRRRLFENIAGSLSQVNRPDEVHPPVQPFPRADSDSGPRPRGA